MNEMGFSKQNKVIRVSFFGGIIGLLVGSHRGKLENNILKMNADGWNLAEVIPDHINLILWILRLLLFLVTLGLWTLGTGYILVFERPARSKLSRKDLCITILDSFNLRDLILS